MSKVNQDERAYHAWNALAKFANKRLTITYGKLAKSLKIHHRPVRYFLDLIQKYCLNEKLPPLTILVVDQHGVQGAGFIAWDVNNLKEGFEKVYDYPWGQMENPFQFAAGGETQDDLVSKLIENPNQSADIYARVRVRGAAQNIFRKTMLQAYDNRCAFSGIGIQEVLEAVHIVPWSKCDHKERLDPRNGLLLTALHHKLFDAGKVTLLADYTVFVSDELRNRNSIVETERALLENLHGTKVRLPLDKALWPMIEIIRRRNETLK